MGYKYRLILIIVMLALFLSVAPIKVQACSCVPPAPPQEALQKSKVVFAGKVIDMDQDGMRDKKVLVAVSTTWKGANQAEIWITTPAQEPACGFDFKENEEYLIYAYESEKGELVTNICLRTKLLSAAQEDLQALGEGKKISAEKENPTPKPLPDVHPAKLEEPNVYWLFLGIGVLIIIVFMLIYRAKRKD